MRYGFVIFLSLHFRSEFALRQRLAELLCISFGCAIGYFTGDPLRLLDDVQTLKPQYFPSVPRVLNKIYQGAMLAGNVPGFRGAVFRKAVATKLETLHYHRQVTFIRSGTGWSSER